MGQQKIFPHLKMGLQCLGGPFRQLHTSHDHVEGHFAKESGTVYSKFVSHGIRIVVLPEVQPEHCGYQIGIGESGNGTENVLQVAGENHRVMGRVLKLEKIILK